MQGPGTKPAFARGMRRLSIALTFILAPSISLALKANYRIYSQQWSSAVGNTSSGQYQLTGKKSGSYHQVAYKVAGQTRYGWVHRFAVTSNDKVASFSSDASNYTVKSSYNVRSSPSLSSRVLSVDEKNVKLTGRTKGTWYEVVASDGQKGWVNRMGVTKAPSVIPARAATASPARESAATEVATTVIAKPAQVVPTKENIQPAPKDSFEIPAGTTFNTDSGIVTTVPEKIATQKPVAPTATPAAVTSQPEAKPEPVKPVILNPGAADAPVVTTTTPPLKADAPSAQPQTTPASADQLKVSSGECAFTDSVMQKNCEQLVAKANSGALPKKAVLFALKVFQETAGNYCGGKTIDNKYRNKCSFFVTDLDDVYGGNHNRSPAYLIDLCAGDKKRTQLNDIVYKTFTNRGTGSGGRRGTANYGDVPNSKTTLPGIFMTKGLSGFDPFPKSVPKYKNLLGYKPNDPRCEGKGTWKNQFLKNCPVLRLEVERLTNTRTDDSKPMHTSPFQSSSGCPSLEKKDNWVMRHLASQGNSLYIAHTARKDQDYQFKAHNKICSRDADKIGDPFSPIGDFGGAFTTQALQ